MKLVYAKGYATFQPRTRLQGDFVPAIEPYVFNPVARTKFLSLQLR